MKFTSFSEDNRLNIQIEGSIDAVTAPALRDELSGLPVESASSVTVDLEMVHYISSAGLREFLILQKRFPNGKLKIINAGSAIRDIFDLTGFSDLFDVIALSEKERDFSGRSFKAFLEDKMARSEDAVVFEDETRSLSWKDLDIASSIVAEDLVNLGAKKGSHIAICGINSINWYITFFAIHKIGAMAILVNPLLKASDICNLSHVGDITILCHGVGPWLADDPAAFLAEIKDPEKSCIKALYDISKPVDIENRGVSPLITNLIDSIETRNDDPCVMIFTSGSTGIPKGVLLSSYNMLTAARCGMEAMGPADDDIMCLILPLFHIFGLVGSFIALICDLKVVLPPKVKPDIILETIRDKHCSLMLSVPTLLMGMASSPVYSLEVAKKLRGCLLGGAPVSEPQMLYLQKQFPNTAFCIAYGLSEMSPVSLTKKNDTIEHITKTVGAPIDLIKIRIQNVETKEDCAIGEVGEILIQGEFLMSGYYKTPIEQQDFDSEGWFHTGDLAFLDEENYIHFAGRKKELIIRGGENIFPGEIAEVATSYKSIAAVQIIGIPDDYYGEIVGCALVIREGETFDEKDFIDYLKEKLAPYKIPAFIKTYTAFPLLANGKVDMLSLRKDLIVSAKQ